MTQFTKCTFNIIFLLEANKFFPQTLNVSPVVLATCWKPHKIWIHICSCYIQNWTDPANKNQ